MIRSLKHAVSVVVLSDRIWLSGEAATAGLKKLGDFWVLTSGLDLQPPTVCAGFRTLSLVSVQNLGRRDSHLMKLPLDRARIRYGESCVYKENIHI